MPLLEFGAVTVAAFWAYIIASVVADEGESGGTTFVSTAYWLFFAHEVGIIEAGMTAAAGVL